VTPKHQAFGGDWTEEKLARLGKYLPAYTKILQSRPFTYFYIDAFAGPGYRQVRRKQQAAPTLWAEDPDARGRAFTAGSAIVAMRTDPPFQRYVFIESDEDALQKLGAALAADFPDRMDRVHLEPGDANAVLKRYCAQWKSGYRAVLFLDPYGMEVEWSTMEAIAKTQGIDVWILFPAGIGVNRQLGADGNVPVWAQDAFDRLFGTRDWHGRFYAKGGIQDLFGGGERSTKVADASVITAFYLERLASIFPHVAPKPLVLCNRNEAPMFALFFAAAHPKYGATAVKIAQHILEN
jgi:three-Cys-motif partner protein